MAKREVVLVSCMTCRKAMLVQWGRDPIISLCYAKREREVARQQRNCKYYEKEEGEKPIRKMQ